MFLVESRIINSCSKLWYFLVESRITAAANNYCVFVRLKDNSCSELWYFLVDSVIKAVVDKQELE